MEALRAAGTRAGATGAKIVGAGGGGCLLFVAPEPARVRMATNEEGLEELSGRPAEILEAPEASGA